MKNKTHQLFCLLHRFFIALLFCYATAIAQESTPQEFVLDASMGYESLFDNTIYNSFIDCGFNSMMQRATTSSQTLLENLNLHAFNMQDSLQWIYYYSSSYYSKWEAEEDQPYWDRVGVKHSAGEVAYWTDENDSILCWSTKGVTGPVDTLVYGPTYHQEKWYRRWLYQENLYNLQYTPRFRMALDNPHSVPDTQDVCRIYVILKYRVIEDDTAHHSDSIFVLKEPVTLKVSDFPGNGNFGSIYFSDFVEERSYEYWSGFRDPQNNRPLLPTVEGIYREDKWGGHGVQFCIDWLRTDTLCTLYIDNIEVYDNNGWNDFIIDPIIPTLKIREYANNFSGWNNIKRWMGGHEPSSIDSYIPIKTVNTILVDSANAPPLMNTVWAHWDLNLNGESQLERYYNMVRPNKLLVEFHPVTVDSPIHPFGLEVLRRILQESYRVTQDSGFYYHAQSYGEKQNGVWDIFRFPTVGEHKATIMLALSHGADGIIQAQYNSEPQVTYNELYGLIGLAPKYDTTDVWFSLRDNLIPRIKGKLGKTLMSLKYTGDYLYLGRNLTQLCCGFENSLPSVSERYLTLTEYIPDSYGPPVHFHVGFFSKPGYEFDNYFMLDNLITTNERKVWINIVPPFPGYKNYRFRNVEGVFDTTFDGFSNGIKKLLTHPEGEGYLYQVAPVVLYGGRLIHNEYAGENQVLTDDMIIENGATLSISEDYYAHANIIVKNGTIFNYNNGAIHFAANKKLIVEGPCTIQGTSGNKLSLKFSIGVEGDTSGIIIKPGGSLTISNAKVENAVTGIYSLVNANYLNAQYVDFINCGTHSVNILGFSGPEQPSTPAPSIKYCNINNSEYGISVTNLSQIVIQENTITSTGYGIYMANVTTPAIIGNHLTGTKQGPGIFLESCNGVVRGNWITEHTNALHIGNSSPDIGANTIFRNWNRGIYVGVGSLPNLEGRLVQDPVNPNLFYAVSGYNKIYENGGWTEEDDGSEIFVTDANLILRRGCNEILDQRIPNAEETPPLYNTQLLMNCEGSYQLIEIYADENYWGVHPIYPLEERFGNCIVYYEPFREEPCPQPDGGGGKFPITSKTGEVIDTLYADQRTIGSLTETEEQYAIAEENFLTGNLSGAMQTYESIITGNATEEEKYFAYQRKYEIGRLTDQPPEFFNTLGNSFLTIASNVQDPVTVKLFTQLSILCKVSEEEYLESINQFDGIVQQNPNTEEAVYAEIDALTTALLIEEADSTLQKGRMGKYLVKNSNDYSTKVDEILKKHFGGSTLENEEETLPTEFTLYQNFPNPFNPATVIKYDLPDVSDVSLIIYDILGRKVKELVNTKQQAGRYEVQFNATSLASGVYIYQIIADNPATSSGQRYINSKKMILLK